MKHSSVLALAVSVVARPLLGELGGALGLDGGPSVNIRNGTVVGTSALGVESFLGIPFALPPTGQLRLKRPVAYEKNFGTLQATGYAPACIQTRGGINSSQLPEKIVSALLNSPLGNAIGDQHEDCLYLNVQRPANVTKGAKLPVVVWIYGGGFQFGATNSYNAAGILLRGNLLKAPFIYVNMAYRLSAFGWMPGKEIQRDGHSNIGLHDQRLAMMWVQENIEEFGGDPDHVVIWGESAGSISVFDHTVINDGDNTYKGKAMFHGAVMNSGSVVPTREINSTKAQGVYDMVVQAANCSSSNDTLNCLRGLSTEDFTTAVNTPPGIFSYDSVSLPFLPRPDPSTRFFPASPENIGLSGGFARVPIIIGDQEDEGTIFSLGQNNLTTNDDVVTYLSDVFFPGTPLEYISGLCSTYPEEAESGSPFRTNDTNNVYKQYKRVAAMRGDFVFTLTRRAYLEVMSTQVNSWSYLNSYLYGTPVLGTFHGADIEVMYGPIPTTFQNPQLPIDYLISFFSFLDPNELFSRNASANCTASVFWPMWKNDDRTLLNFNALNTTYLADDFRSAQFEGLKNATGKLRA